MIFYRYELRVGTRTLFRSNDLNAVWRMQGVAAKHDVLAIFFEHDMTERRAK